MHGNRAHPLLEQVPLTVSPFVHLPRSVTLPYRYKTMPSTLPATILDGPPPTTPGNGTPTTTTTTTASGKPPYVVSPSSGTAAHPDDILASCQALRGYLAKMQADADADLRRLEERIRERDLAEKRRLAPGWLDSDARLLVPERAQQQQQQPGDNDDGDDGAREARESAALPSEMAAAPVPVTTSTTHAATGGGEQAAAEAEAAAGGITAEALDQAFGSIQIR